MAELSESSLLMSLLLLHPIIYLSVFAGDRRCGGCDRVPEFHRQEQKPRLRLRRVRVPQSGGDGPEEAVTG